MNVIDFKGVANLNWFDADGLNFEDTINRIAQLTAPSEKKRKSSILGYASGNNLVFVANSNLTRKISDGTINKYARMLIKAGTKLLFLRGALTPPEMFENDSSANREGEGAITFVPDYTVVEVEHLSGINFNTLFIGGQITPERSWKLKKALHTKKHAYYPQEAPVYDEAKLNEILESDIQLTAIFANYAPSFIENPISESVDNWAKSDDRLISDMERLSEWFDGLSSKMKKSKKQVKLWIYPSTVERSNINLPNISYVSADLRSIDLITALSCTSGNKKGSFSKYHSMIDSLEREVNLGHGIMGGRMRAPHLEMPQFVMPHHLNDPFNADEGEELPELGDDITEDMDEPEEQITVDNPAGERLGATSAAAPISEAVTTAASTIDATVYGGFDEYNMPWGYGNIERRPINITYNAPDTVITTHANLNGVGSNPFDDAFSVTLTNH